RRRALVAHLLLLLAPARARGARGLLRQVGGVDDDLLALRRGARLLGLLADDAVDDVVVDVRALRGHVLARDAFDELVLPDLARVDDLAPIHHAVLAGAVVQHRAVDAVDLRAVDQLQPVTAARRPL